MLTRKQKRAIVKCVAVAEWLNSAIDNLVNDPMTDAMGAPVDDIVRDWRARARGRIRNAQFDLPQGYRHLSEAFW